MKQVLLNWMKRLRDSMYRDSPLQKDIQHIQSLAEEAVWHHVFHESQRWSGTQKNLNIGRWAGGPSFFFVLKRIIEIQKPNYILEMGLGESSKFISSKLEEIPGAAHWILEHDERWIEIFQNSNSLNPSSVIELSPLVHVEHQEDGINGLAYQSVRTDHWQKADLIVVDGPQGRGEYARANVLDLVPHLHPDRSFAVLFDDTHRQGEQNTVGEFLDRLHSAGITAHRADFGGLKACSIVCSQDLVWLLTV